MGVDPVRVGIVLREQDLSDWSGRLAELAERAVAGGIDHLTVGDHVSFANGHGADGLIQATALLSAHPSLSVQTGVYLVGLRHPAIVARQLATIALLAQGDSRSESGSAGTTRGSSSCAGSILASGALGPPRRCGACACS